MPLMPRVIIKSRVAESSARAKLLDREGTAIGAALVAIALSTLVVVASAGAATTIPYKKYGSLSRTLTNYVKQSPSGIALPGYHDMYWHYKGTFPTLAKNEYIQYNGFYEGSRTRCWQYVEFGDMQHRRQKDPHMFPVTYPPPSAGYNHTFCPGEWFGEAQVYKQGKNEAHPVLTIARFSFKVDK